jgi:hypothetical protein
MSDGTSARELAEKIVSHSVSAFSSGQDDYRKTSIEYGASLITLHSREREKSIRIDQHEEDCHTCSNCKRHPERYGLSKCVIRAALAAREWSAK